MDLYSQEQMDEMMMRGRTWVLNNPSGPLPDMPFPAYRYKDNLLSKRANDAYEYPNYKEPHWFIAFLMKLRIL